MTNSTEEKKKVFKGIGTAWVLTSIFIGSGIWLSKRHDWFADYSGAQVLALALLPVALSLAIGIGWAARTRHFKQNINGSAPKTGTSLDITLRYIQNTLEQAVLFAFASFCLLVSSPDLAKTVLPVLGLWFFIARMMFWHGYRRAPLARAVGFASTFHPTLVILIYSAIMLFP